MIRCRVPPVPALRGAMARCPKCGSEIPHDGHACPECGLTIPQTDFTQISDKTVTGDPFGAAGEQALSEGSILGGRYEILAVIGKGGMGWVYKARDREIDRIVALKVIREDLARDENIIKRFRDEIILARKVTHKNVLRIYDIAEAEGRKFISMPYIEGRDLKDVITEEGALDIERALEISRQVLEALKSAHEAGVIHRDLKPQNIMIDKEGSVCVADFGIAKSADTGGLTVTGQIVGTPEYMSPEQAEGKDVDFRSDIYSFGLILYEMLTGRVPFKADSIISTLMLRLREKPQAPSKDNSAVPPWLDRLVMRTLEKEVEERYASADEVLRDIELQTVKRRIRLKPRALALIAVVAVIGVAAAVFIGRRPKLVMEEGRIYLAILPFENSASDPDLDWLTSGIPDNLTADLAQSKFFRVMSPERLRQIAVEIGQDIGAMGTPEAMAMLAKATDLDYVTTGTFFRAGDKIRITMKILEVANQEIKGSDIVQDDESELLAMIDDLTRKTKQIFDLSQDEIAQDLDRAMGEQRTRSVKAASEFSKGLQYSYAGAHLDAARSFENAVAADGDFAMAYAKASEAYKKLGYDEKAESLSLIAVDKAMKFSDRVPPSDRTFIMANHADITYNTDKAIESYKEFVEAYPDDPEGYYKLAMAYGATSEWDQAVQNLREALRLDPKWGSARFELGKALIMQNDLDAALRELELAQEAYRDIGNKEGEAAVLNAIGILYKRRNEFDKAIEKYEASIAIKEELGDKRGVAASLTNIGTVYEIMGNRDRALEVLEQSLEIKREIGDRLGISTALIKIGHIYLYSGRYDEALSYIERSYEIREELGAKHLMASSLSDLGYVYSLLGDSEKSLEMEERALALHREIGDEDGEAEVLRNIAETQILRGEFDKASENLNQVVAIHTRLGDSRRLAWDSKVLGHHALSRGKVDSALIYFTRSLSEHEALEEKPALAMIRTQMGEVYLAKDDFKQALSEFGQAYTIAREVEESESTVDALLGEGRLYFEVGYWAGCDSIMKELGALNDRDLTYQTRCRLSLAQARRQYAKGDRAGALKAAEDLVAVTGDEYVRCGVEAMLLSARILIDQADYARAAQVLEDVRSRAGSHSLRDLEAQALCLLGKVRAGQGRYDDAIALCTEGIDLTGRLGLATYDCRAICGEVNAAAGDTQKALELLGLALDEASAVYREKCPSRMLHSYLEAKHVSEHVSQIESILTGLGRTQDALAYRAKFPLN
jgi:serine/threonine protein kinase/Tfp pilus assembly protein PilF/predicted negative regulator of RcsB-dependent stress response